MQTLLNENVYTLNTNAAEYRVSEISSIIKSSLEDKFSNIRIKGEISGLKAASSGHVYFTLKDNTSTLNTVCWKNTAIKIPFPLEDGMEVVCTGSITTYPARSYYQLTVKVVEIAGVGVLLAMLEKRKKKFEESGMFDAVHKKPLPYLPDTIGIITSPTGAVIEDMLHRLTERFPVHVLLWGVLVQGKDAANQVANAITGFNKLSSHIKKPDLLIVARGGGSIEDLWTFNEEIVVQAVFNSVIPIISAIGHETDTTLIDYVADKRAPTPTAAAEIAVPVLSDLKYTINSYAMRLRASLPNVLRNNQYRLNNCIAKLASFQYSLTNLENRMTQLEFRLKSALDTIISAFDKRLKSATDRFKPEKLSLIINHNENKISQLTAKMNSNLDLYLYQVTHRLDIQSKLLENLNYKNVLQRGFSIIRDETNNLISSAQLMKPDKLIKIEFKDGVKEAITLDPNKLKLY